VKDLFLAKCVHTPEERVFIIGGSKDKQALNSLADVQEYIFNKNGQFENVI